MRGLCGASGPARPADTGQDASLTGASDRRPERARCYHGPGDETDPRWRWKLEKHRQIRHVRARASELGWEIYKLGPREE